MLQLVPLKLHSIDLFFIKWVHTHPHPFFFNHVESSGYLRHESDEAGGRKGERTPQGIRASQLTSHISDNQSTFTSGKVLHSYICYNQSTFR